MICVSIAESSVGRCLEALKGIDLAEIRIDKMQVDAINVFSRPLLHHENSIESAKKILENRIHVYAKASDLVISTENGDTEKIARSIKDEIDQAF